MFGSEILRTIADGEILYGKNTILAGKTTKPSR